MEKEYFLGIDIGSTTVKIAILDEDKNIKYSRYERHFANIQGTLLKILEECDIDFKSAKYKVGITGSGGLALAEKIKADFIQEVIAVSETIQLIAPQTDVAIELGGEDAKIIYFGNTIEQRMNGICAGGTGSFIDQMASLLQTDATGLNELSKSHTTIYPIAARCGVFAKTDIQPLINEGPKREDLAASIFQAVVNQTISGLACGKPIKGNIAFLGGPLHFLPELREAFVRTLKLTDKQNIKLENTHLFAAIGSAISVTSKKTFYHEELEDLFRKKVKLDVEVERLEPLFKNENEYNRFMERHEKNAVTKKRLDKVKGNLFLGIDSGSTTAKVALIDEKCNLVYSSYSSNKGNPLEVVLDVVKDIYKKLPAGAKIVSGCSTGYGELLIKNALNLETSEVETVAHYYAASYFNKDVDCILDIGGQDMKCMKLHQGVIDSVLLNEACSSGCGSFIETFAKGLNYSVEDFARIALASKKPINLGTRCTVFMNSKVKQAQKEGAKVEDISAGLAYSVIKNALYKVIKISDAKDLGKNIVVQGGTFYNDAVLRCLELEAGVQVIRPDIAGIMGAFGACLIAKERYNNNTTILGKKEVEELKYKVTTIRCKSCTNNCLLTVNSFSNGSKFISGNRCEKGISNGKQKEKLPNLYEYKRERFLDYTPLNENVAPRGVIGIPRVLNMYENYPFWFRLFTELGYRVILSPNTTKDIYKLGINSIPSESECYPAKLVHGHIMWLLEKEIKTIFYPCVVYEKNEVEGTTNHYNCPMVTSYAENIKNNVEEIREKDINFIYPFISFESKKILQKRLEIVLEEKLGISKKEIKSAVNLAWEELGEAKSDLKRKGEETLKYLKENNKSGIVRAGRPYHIDKEINHGRPELISSYDLAVFTEDSISHLAKVERPLIVSDQWMYHSRLYAAAEVVKNNEFLDLIQLNSFGCGLDAVTTDQVKDILNSAGKPYTCLKIDEISNLGAARIRLRSLLAAIRLREKNNIQTKVLSSAYKRTVFTKEMKSDYTVLFPNMSPIHFELLEPALKASGLNARLLDDATKQSIDLALKYTNNDACYPSLIVVGQILSAMFSGDFDTKKVAVMITQTGGGCRATNYIGFIRRALEKAGFKNVPVISLSAGIEKNPGFKISYTFLSRAIQGIIYGDLFMKVVYRTRPYEIEKGSVDKLHEKWKEICLESLKDGNIGGFEKNIKNIIKEFDNIPLNDEIRKPKVGIVGEILVKFSPSANNNLVEVLEKEGAEAVMPDMLDFFLYCFYNSNFRYEFLGKSQKSAMLNNIGIKFVEKYRSVMKKELKKSSRFYEQTSIQNLAESVKEIVSLGNQTGEGWFLTAEMLELIENDVPNIVCAQPFGCLPNHIVGKGVMKELKEKHKDANIVAIDYDPGASEVNQLNRIKLMLSTARKNMKNKK